MWRYLLVDVAHAALWALHGILFLFFVFLTQLSLLFWIPAQWTLSLGNSWRLGTLASAFVLTCVLVYASRRMIFLQPLRTHFRLRMNILSFQWKGVALGDVRHADTFIEESWSAWFGALKHSLKGPWVHRWAWSFVGLAILFAAVSRVPPRLALIGFGLIPVRLSNLVSIDEALLEFPNYTEQQPLVWNMQHALPVTTAFLRGSAFSLRFQKQQGAVDVNQLRIVYAGLPLATQWVPETQRYISQFQLSREGSLTAEVILYDRFWTEGSKLFQFVMKPDFVPDVQVRFMREAQKIIEGERLQIHLKVRDDFGIQSIRLEIEQGDQKIDEIIKYFSEPLLDHEEMFDWDTTGVPLKAGSFAVRVVALDACPDERTPSKGFSESKTYTFVPREDHFQAVQQLLEKWLTSTSQMIQTLETDGLKPSVLPYVQEGESFSKKLEQEPSLGELNRDWQHLSQRLQSYQGQESELQELHRAPALKDLRVFHAALKAALEKREQEEMDESANAVWDAFDAYKDAHQEGAEKDESKRRLTRENMQAKLKEWTKSFEKMNSEELLRWKEQQSVEKALKQGAMNQESVASKDLQSMEDQLAQGMSLWEQAVAQKEQERMNELRRKVDEALEVIEAAIERETKIKEGTYAASERDTKQWERLSQGQAELHSDTSVSIDVLSEKLSGEPLFQSMTRNSLQQAQRFMSMAQESLEKSDRGSAMIFEDKVIQSLANSSRTLSFMMQQMGQQAQYARGRSGRNHQNYFKRSLNGPFEGPKEYRDALRKMIRDDKGSPFQQEKRREYYRRLIK